MKNLIILSALALIGFSSCKKDISVFNKVEYKFICDECTVVVDHQNKLNDTILVKQFYNITELNNLKIIKLDIAGKGLITSKVIVNNVTIHSQSVIQNGEKISYKINIK